MASRSALPAAATPVRTPLAARAFWVIAHRWAGLTLALFLGVAGLTGSLLPWIEELEAATAPGLHLAPATAQPLDPLALREAALRRHPGADINFLPLTIDPGKSLRLHLEWIDPRTGLEREDGPGWDDLFIDPATGRELGRREWGAISQGVKNLMPFLYRLHYSLALGTLGTLMFGVAALVWTLDCFVGFYLTLPLKALQPVRAPSFWQRWRPSWRVRWGSSPYKINFDLHRAGGLWIWPFLLVFAWSSVSFNLPQVYVPVMSALGGEDARQALADAHLRALRRHPAMNFAAAERRGAHLARQEAARAGVSIRPDGERWLWHVPTSGLYVYGFTTTADIGHHGGGTRVAFDSNSGALKLVELPSGQNGTNTFGNWLAALHMGEVFGLPYRVFVSLTGLLVTALSVTGVVIWLRKRSARAGRMHRHARSRGAEAA